MKSKSKSTKVAFVLFIIMFLIIAGQWLHTHTAFDSSAFMSFILDQQQALMLGGALIASLATIYFVFIKS